MTLSPLKVSSAIALVDCNNFYVSCERVFDPSLENRPVAVLSSNDGCVISRSQEMKDLRIPMGTPFFKYEHLLEKAGSRILSSNYELYGDMSRRVAETLETFTPDIEKYSIDESFLEIQESKKSFDYIGREIQEKVYKWTDIPVGVGFAATKTLAKIANRIAKQSAKAKGVVNLYKSPYIDVALERTKVSDIWGIGSECNDRLRSWKVSNALQFKYLPVAIVKKHFTIRGVRILQEINGLRALPLELTPPLKKSITCSRSFGELLENPSQIFNAVSTFLMSAVEKLREHKLAAHALTVYIHTDRFKPQDNYRNSYTYNSVYPTDNIFELQHWAGNCFDRIFKSGSRYKKAGVDLTGLIPREGVTTRIYHEERLAPRLEKLNLAMDEINAKFGRNTIRLAVAQENAWKSRAERMSPRYTTRIKDIVKLK